MALAAFLLDYANTAIVAVVLTGTDTTRVLRLGGVDVTDWFYEPSMALAIPRRYAIAVETILAVRLAGTFVPMLILGQDESMIAHAEIGCEAGTVVAGLAERHANRTRLVVLVSLLAAANVRSGAVTVYTRLFTDRHAGIRVRIGQSVTDLAAAGFRRGAISVDAAPFANRFAGT